MGLFDRVRKVATLVKKTTDDLPYTIDFDCMIIEGNFRRAATGITSSINELNFPPLKQWTSPNESNGEPAKLATHLKTLPEAIHDVDDEPLYIQLDFGHIIGSIRFERDWGTTGLTTLTIQFVITKTTRRPEVLLFQSQCLTLANALLQRLELFRADLTAHGGGLKCLPDVALVDPGSHTVVTNEAEVEQHYADPQAFWNAGWTLVAEHNGQRLLARGMDLIAGPRYLEHILPHTWAMARAAKAESTGYADFEVTPEEAAIFHAGAGRLHFVGATDALAEYACALGAGEHIRGWEVFALRQIVETGQLPGGEPVDTVRVVFAERWMAEQEKRPLLDVGCKVFVQTRSGKLKELKH